MRRDLIIAVLLLVCIAGCANAPASAPAVGTTTVVWLSIDGLRHDYLERFQPPTLTRLAREGASTTHLRPIFPTLTFPNHVAQVTGTTAERSGVVSNTFFDSATGLTYNLPNESSLLRSEPIWTTAKRQGVRAAVLGWPMSYQQSGPFAIDYFEPAFDPKLTDAQRLEDTVRVVKADTSRPPYRLVITYASRVDTVGHRFGPDSPQVGEALRELDASLDAFHRAVLEWFDATHAPADELVFLITTDHGMEPVHTLVNLQRLIGADLTAGAKLVTGGPLASIHLTDVPADQRNARARQIAEKLQGAEYVRAWAKPDVPPRLHLSDPTRVGEVVVLLAPGYGYGGERFATTYPTTAGRRGAHGYDPESCDNMRGCAVVWRYRRPLGGKDLGPIDNTQWHATVARLLGIAPAPGADPRPVPLPPPAD